jgi:hypothetical protein
VWQGTVNAGGQLLELVLNDRTGRIMCAVNLGDAISPAESGRIGAPIDTPGQAATVSLNAARKLLSIPNASEIALAKRPHRLPQDSYWTIAWNVRNTQDAKTYPVNVILNREDGRLVSIANGEELNRANGR